MDNDQTSEQNDSKVYLIGGGIASLAAAAFLIRDVQFRAKYCHSGAIGSLRRQPRWRRVGRRRLCSPRGRMIESKYVCTYELFSSIPTLDGTKSVTQEIFDWNKLMQTSSKSPPGA